MVDSSGGANRATTYTADPKLLSLRVLDCPRDSVADIETPRIFNIDLLFSTEDDAVKTKAFLDDQKERQIDLRGQKIKDLLDRWSYELEIKK